MSKKINRLLLTGAAGGLGKVLRPRLGSMATTVRVSDVADVGDAGAQEEIVRCDLGDYDAMLALLQRGGGDVMATLSASRLLQRVGDLVGGFAEVADHIDDLVLDHV